MKRLDEVAGAGWTVLTARERDVIRPVAEGKSNKLIAMELGISMRTVEAHRARIFYKMGVRNAVQLARAFCSNPHGLAEPAHEPTALRRGIFAARRAIGGKRGGFATGD